MIKSVTVIIPCFNEEKRLQKDVFSSYTEFNILFVDDGSVDNTWSILSDLSNSCKHISSIRLHDNVGKAEAIRQGVLQLKDCDVVGYLDADLSTSLQEMNRLIEIFKESSKLMVMGSRIKIAGNTIERYWWRHYSGRFIASIIDGFFLKSGIYDTQCGAKVIDGKIAFELFKKPFVTRWLFDVELLLRLKQLDKSDLSLRVQEIPLKRWIDKGGSSIKFIDILNLPLSFFKLFLTYL